MASTLPMSQSCLDFLSKSPLGLSNPAITPRANMLKAYNILLVQPMQNYVLPITPDVRDTMNFLPNLNTLSVQEGGGDNAVTHPVVMPQCGCTAPGSCSHMNLHCEFEVYSCFHHYVQGEYNK